MRKTRAVSFTTLALASAMVVAACGNTDQSTPSSSGPAVVTSSAVVGNSASGSASSSNSASASSGGVRSALGPRQKQRRRLWYAASGVPRSKIDGRLSARVLQRGHVVMEQQHRSRELVLQPRPPRRGTAHVASWRQVSRGG